MSPILRLIFTSDQAPDPCDGFTCLNGGSCVVDETGAALCNCDDGYIGPDCGDGMAIVNDIRNNWLEL